MNDTISDTGPILHLSEIDRLSSLNIFERLYIPALVVAELEQFGIEPDSLNIDPPISTVTVGRQQRQTLLQSLAPPPIHPADAEVFLLAQDEKYPDCILTDDMALRRHLEQKGFLVVGSVGILIRSYHTSLISQEMLRAAIDDLFTVSTLHARPAFRLYVRNLIDRLD